MTGTTFVARWGAATDRGHVRRHNEDALLATPPFFLVADGMGGHSAGDVAAGLVVDAFSPYVERAVVGEGDVRAAVVAARQAIVDYFRTAGSSGGSTLTGVAMSAVGDDPALVVVNIGDSRTYRLSGGRLDQLSKDHSTVQELLDAGTIRPEDVRTHPERNIITRAISPTADAEPDVWTVPAVPGDRYLACSDGLTGELSDARVQALLLAYDDPQDAAHALVRAALAEQGRDNVTAVVVDVVRTVQGGPVPADRVPADLIDTELDEDTVPTR